MSKYLSYAGWTAVWAMVLYFLLHNVIRYFDPTFSIYTPDFSSIAPFLVIHIAMGTIALIIGPFQFIPSLRKKYTNVHRLMGKIYLTAVLIGSLSGAYLAIFDNIIRKEEFMFATGILGLASAWFISGAMAFWAIRKRNFVQHREWMVRCYVVTFAFITFRILYYSLLAIEGFKYKDDIGGLCAWFCWSVPLLVTEVILQARKISRS